MSLFKLSKYAAGWSEKFRTICRSHTCFFQAAVKGGFFFIKKTPGIRYLSSNQCRRFFVLFSKNFPVTVYAKTAQAPIFPIESVTAKEKKRCMHRWHFQARNHFRNPPVQPARHLKSAQKYLPAKQDAEPSSPVFDMRSFFSYLFVAPFRLGEERAEAQTLSARFLSPQHSIFQRLGFGINAMVSPATFNGASPALV